jgi:hypothetical protein
MPNDSHQRAAEFQQLAAHAHRVAAAHRGKEDHQTGRDHSEQALRYAYQALQWSQESHRKSMKLAANALDMHAPDKPSAVRAPSSERCHNSR